MERVLVSDTTKPTLEHIETAMVHGQMTGPDEWNKRTMALDEQTADQTAGILDDITL